MSSIIQRRHRYVNFFWYRRSRYKVALRRVVEKFAFHRLNYQEVSRREYVPGVINYNQYFAETLLPRINEVLAVYNNNLRPIVYVVDLDLLIEDSPQTLMGINVDQIWTNLSIRHLNVDHRYKLTRSPVDNFRRPTTPWRLRGSIIIQVGFFPSWYRPRDPDETMDVDTPVWIRNRYSHHLNAT